MSTLMDSMEAEKAFISSVRAHALELKAAGNLPLDLSVDGSFGSINEWQSRSRYQQRYALNRGVLYSAVNALAMEGASQPVNVKRLVSKAKPKGKKSAEEEKEVVTDHPLVEALKKPNSIQNKWQFIYSFIASISLTGWGYIIGEVDKDGKIELYSIPTTWITPDHTKGPFSAFKLANPNKPGSESKTLDARNVAFAYLPDPSDMLSALSPASTQLPAIKSNDNIWESRLQFFKNGIFPGAIVTVGGNPHPGVPAGVRPRLTAAQRRAVYAVIKKLMGGIANHGNPAIVDGMIEKIERLSMDSKEMGWEKSEPATKAAILSAFCVHPYILGEAVSVGGYAQVANIEKRFYKRINTYLEMLSNLLTNFIKNLTEEEGLEIEVEPCVATDPTLEWSNWKYARSNGDITQNELREKLGLPPDEDDNQSTISPQLLQPIVQLLAQKAAGSVTVEQVKGLLVGLGLPEDIARVIAGKELPPPATQPQPQEQIRQEQKPIPGTPVIGKPKPATVQALQEAVKELREVPKVEMSRLEKIYESV